MRVGFNDSLSSFICDLQLNLGRSLPYSAGVNPDIKAFHRIMVQLNDVEGFRLPLVLKITHTKCKKIHIIVKYLRNKSDMCPIMYNSVVLTPKYFEVLNLPDVYLNVQGRQDFFGLFLSYCELQFLSVFIVLISNYFINFLFLNCFYFKVFVLLIGEHEIGLSLIYGPSQYLHCCLTPRRDDYLAGD